MEKSEMMEQIRKIETALSVELPEVVVRYLLQREIICEYLDYLDSADEWIECHLTDEVGIYAPGYVMIGSDGGDLRYLMKSGAGETMVYSADVGDMNPQNFERMGTFDECLAKGFAFED